MLGVGLLLLLLLLLAGLLLLLSGVVASLVLSSFSLLDGELLATGLLLFDLLLADVLGPAVPAGLVLLEKDEDEERIELEDTKLDEGEFEERDEFKLVWEDCAVVDTGGLVVSDGLALESVEDMSVEVTRAETELMLFDELARVGQVLLERKDEIALDV